MYKTISTIEDLNYMIIKHLMQVRYIEKKISYDINKSIMES